ncbi:MAG: VIT domain-containing protein [Candidatus Aminicenantales bacterium]
MRKHRATKLLGLALFVFLGTLSTETAYADGFIIPHPRHGEHIPALSVKVHRVQVEIVNQVAKTSVDQVFINNHHRDIEGVYIFPLPRGAAISEFAMYVGGKRVEGEILDRRKARRVYEDIVRRMRDPALLEYVGRNMFRARIFPIPAKGEKRVQISYSEILTSESGLVHYVYPLDTERFSLRPVEQVSLSATISSQLPISSIYSPSHKISVRKEGKTKARVSFEATNVKPDKDFSLYYGLTQDEVGLSWMNYDGPEGRYFLLLASPSYVASEEKVVNKNLVFVLDSSGSMSGSKIQQAKEAARFIIRHLGERDRFSIVDFDDGVTAFSDELVPANKENREKALAFVDGIEDSGGTNINEALLRALKMIPEGERPDYILFLTDGLPTVGVTDIQEILKNVQEANAHSVRVVVFGVGYDVNTQLLDRLSLDNRGTSVYVGKNDDLEMTVSSYYEKISSPLLSDLEIAFENIDVRDVYPRTLPDLFKGSQIVLVGKYTGEGPVTVTLSGRVKNRTKTFALRNRALDTSGLYGFLPRLWATRRIGYLLEEIRLHGETQELVDEVKRLGIRFGIVTPYTSFLVTEEERVSMDAAAPESVAAFAQRKPTGVGGVRIAKATQRFKAEEQVLTVRSQKIRYVEDKTFYLKDGIWVDSTYEEGPAVRKIRFGSKEYYRLLAEKPAIAKYLSVGKNLIVLFEGKVYQIVAEEN